MKLDAPLSPSRITQYQRCPLAFYFKYVEKIELEETPVALKFGSSFHSTLKFFWENVQKGKLLGLDELKEAFTLDWQIAQTVPIAWKDETPEALEETACVMLQTYLENHIEPLPPKAVEMSFKVPIINPATGETLNDVQLFRIIDLIDGEGCLVDHKTSAKAFWDYKKAATDVQLSCYALAYHQIYGADVIPCRFDVIVKNAKKPSFARIETKRTFKDLSRLYNTIKSVVTGIENEVFYPNPNMFCGNCDFSANCKAWGTEKAA